MEQKIVSKTYFRFWRWTRQIGVRAAIMAFVASLAVSLSPYFDPFVPVKLATFVKTDAVTNLLQVLASTMLAVTIFSLSVVLSARQAASSQVTPRSHQVLIEDTVTQNVLSTFLAAFIFSLVALILLGTRIYEGPTIAVILVFTLAVIAFVLMSILRWINHIAELGSVTATSRNIEAAARNALDARQELPCLGARPLTEGQLEIPARAKNFTAWETGYVQHIDLRALSRAAKLNDGNVYVVAQPGELVSLGDTLVYYTADLDESRLMSAFTLADRRVFEQDPRFGVIVLSEIAQRALSPGVNDPGTAIDILARLARVLSGFRDEACSDVDPLLPRIWMSAVTAQELVRDAFDPIARDGAGTVEVQIRLQKTLALLAQSGDETMAKAAKAASARALEFSNDGLLLAEQKARVQELSTLV